MLPKLALSASFLGLLLPLAAQVPAPPAKAVAPAAAKPTGPMGTLSGIVVQKGSKVPLERVQLIMTGPSGSQSGAVSDPDGKFQARVPPGGYQITARLMGATGYTGEPTVTVINVRADAETKVEIEMPKTAELSGRVLDARGDPVQGARVTLLMRSYEVWSPNLVFVNTPFNAQTNDLGEYYFEGVPAGIGFHAFAEIVTPGTAEAVASTAADPDARRPILAGTFYPRSLDPGGAQAIRLSEGEHRENADIQMAQTKSYCAEDVLVPNASPEQPHTITVDLTSIISGVFNGYGSFRSGRTISLDAKGKARVCGLWPGSYRFTVQPQRRTAAGTGEYYGFGEFLVTDKDLTAIPGTIGPVFNWEGEVLLDGPAPANQPQQPIAIGFTNITPTSLGIRVQAEVPGKFTLPNLHFDRELFRVDNLPTGWYVKRVAWGDQDLTERGGRFILNKAGVPVRVLLGADGSRIRVRVTDSNGQPVPGRRVNLIPGGLTSAQGLTARLWSCYSDDRGECSVFALPNEPPKAVFPPGEYVVLAAELPFNQSSDVLDQLWSALRASGTKLTLPPGGTGDATTRPTVLR